MTQRTRLRILVWSLAVLCLARTTAAEVTKIDIKTRAPMGTTGYEKIVGIAHFAVDPKNPRNAAIANIDKAPVNAKGQVEFSADVYILRPLDASRSNGVAFFDVVNRGRKTILRFNQSTASTDGDEGDTASPCPGAAPAPAGRPAGGTPPPPPPGIDADVDLGDGLLTEQGVTLVFVGWQFDVRRRGTSMGIELPKAKGTAGVVRAVITPCDLRERQAATDLAGYPPVDPKAADAVLTVRDDTFTAAQVVPRETWTLENNVVTLQGGFTPGKIYEIAYRTADLPVTGLGLAAFRDVAAWMKRSPEAIAKAQYAYAFGSSQSGRFLRTYLYDGFNSDERNRQVFDGVMAHIAGAARLDINTPLGTPNALEMFTNTVFPFTTASQRDPISGRVDGLLDNDRARMNQPKIFFTNSSVEQWGGGRAAPLITTTADGTRDLPLAENVRYYYFSGTQHSPGRFPPRVVTGQQPYNPVDYWFAMRALFGAMDAWVRKGVTPPASVYPTIADGTLVPVERVAFPAIPGVRQPAGIPHGQQDGKPLPFLVPQVDADGNDRAGLKLPDVAVPLATYTGWNFRNHATGGDALLVNLLGSAIPLPKTKAEAQASHDPRMAIAERYVSKTEYLTRVGEAIDRLVTDGYLLARDRAVMLTRAAASWDWATGTR